MSRLYKILTITFVVVLTLSSIAVMAPRAVHAVVATLIRDVDNGARHPYSQTCRTAANGNGIYTLTCSTPAIPSGEEFVIETVSALIETNGATGESLNAVINTTTNGFNNQYFIQTQPTTINSLGEPETDFLAPLKAYGDQGAVIQLTVQSPVNDIQVIVFTVSGYLVSLP